MKNTYVAPEIEINVLVTDDVIMISNLDVKQSGTLNSVDWNSISD